MKMATVLILLGAAVPASALAQEAPFAGTQTESRAESQAAPAAQAGAPAIKPAARLQTPAARRKQVAAARNWSLDTAVAKQQKRQAQQSAEAGEGQIQGPDMPPEPVVKVPKQRTAKRAAPADKKTRVNAASILAPLIRKGRN